MVVLDVGLSEYVSDGLVFKSMNWQGQHVIRSDSIEECLPACIALPECNGECTVATY
jgi:hypothetical protein